MIDDLGSYPIVAKTQNCVTFNEFPRVDQNCIAKYTVTGDPDLETTINLISGNYGYDGVY